ncbi:MAG: restriction endonuclease subunit S [Pyrinomonadaceae bacterium]
MASNGWRDVHLRDVIKIKHGYPFKSEFFSEDLTGLPIVVGVGNFKYTGGFRFDSTTTKEYRGEYSKEYELKSGDVLLVMTCQTAGGEILGIPGRIPHDGRIYLHNQRLGKVILNRPDLVHLDFLYWVFLWREFNQELVASASGTKIVHTAPSRIEAFKLLVPTLDEQRRIACVLSALDDKIELNGQMNHTLEAMAQALFKSWFVDFDPVTAKAAGRAPFGMNAETAALFPSTFEESDSGLIPTGWHFSTIGQAVTVVGGSTPSTKNDEYWEGGSNFWATPRDLSKLSSPVLIDTERKITDEGLKQISSGQLPLGTVLLSSRAPVGYLAIAEVPVSINQGFIAMKCNDPLNSHYVLHWTRENMDEVLSRAGGTTFAEISKSNFRPIPVLVPSQPILELYNELASELHEKLVNNLRESETLTALRDLLLPKLLSGEVRVGQAEEIVAEAV